MSALKLLFVVAQNVTEYSELEYSCTCRQAGWESQEQVLLPKYSKLGTCPTPIFLPRSTPLMLYNSLLDK